MPNPAIQRVSAAMLCYVPIFGDLKMSFLCPVNDCLCRCDKENGDYCHYSVDEAERQKLEIKTNYSDTAETNIDNEFNKVN